LYIFLLQLTAVEKKTTKHLMCVVKY